MKQNVQHIAGSNGMAHLIARKGIAAAAMCAFSIFILLSEASRSAAQTFSPSCARIGPRNGAIVNVEFSPLGGHASWAESSRTGGWTADYWITPLAADGSFNPKDGRKFLATEHVPWGTFAYWGEDERGVAAYTSNNNNQIFQIAVDSVTGTISSHQLTAPLDRRPQYIYPSRITDAPTTYLVYLKAQTVSSQTYFDITWLDASDPEIEHPLVINGTTYSFPGQFFSNPRWVPNRKIFVFPIFDASSGFIQVAAHHIDTGVSWLLTSDAGNKVDPFPFESPEFPGEWLMLAVAGDTKLALYRMDPAGGGGMSRVKTINSPSQFQYFQSAETFDWNGKTYISTAINQDPAGSRVDPDTLKTRLTELWVFDVAPAGSFQRKINSADVQYALDPETLVSGTGVWFYGYMRRPGALFHELQKCRTGFGN
jgi:hypothetical protein